MGSVSQLSPFQVVSDLSKFQSLCEEVIDLDHLRESGGKHVRVRPQFHAELQRLGEELSGTSEEMLEILKEVEEASKVCIAGRNTIPNYRPYHHEPGPHSGQIVGLETTVPVDVLTLSWGIFLSVRFFSVRKLCIHVFHWRKCPTAGSCGQNQAGVQRGPL